MNFEINAFWQFISSNYHYLIFGAIAVAMLIYFIREISKANDYSDYVEFEIVEDLGDTVKVKIKPVAGSDLK
jgi:hypothetical protein